MCTEDPDILKQKKAALHACLSRFRHLGIAFSGGVDSTLLLAEAREALGDRVVAFTAVSDIHPDGEKQAAMGIAEKLGVRHVLFSTAEMSDPAFIANPPDRCYYCKKGLFKIMWARAEALGIQSLAHGANVDDLSDFRPGFKAAAEMRIAAPLIEAGLSKADIRGLAKLAGLDNWDRPAGACLATRIPYDVEINRSLLSKIDQAEQFIRGLGAKHCRVRHYGHLAGIEVGAEELESFARPLLRAEVVKKLRALGYADILLDLEGYRPGKMNRHVDDGT